MCLSVRLVIREIKTVKQKTMRFNYVVDFFVRQIGRDEMKKRDSVQLIQQQF